MRDLTNKLDAECNAAFIVAKDWGILALLAIPCFIIGLTNATVFRIVTIIYILCDIGIEIKYKYLKKKFLKELETPQDNGVN